MRLLRAVYEVKASLELCVPIVKCCFSPYINVTWCWDAGLLQKSGLYHCAPRNAARLDCACQPSTDVKLAVGWLVENIGSENKGV